MFFNDELKWHKSASDFFKFLLHVVHLPPKDGFVSVLVSGAGTPYGYIIVVNNTNLFSKRTMHVYALYTNNQCPSASVELIAEARQWGVANKYEEVQACSYRFGGAAIRLFTRKLGFTSRFIVFTRPV